MQDDAPLSRRALGWSVGAHVVVLVAAVLASRFVATAPPPERMLLIEAVLVSQTRAEPTPVKNPPHRVVSTSKQAEPVSNKPAATKPVAIKPVVSKAVAAVVKAAPAPALSAAAAAPVTAPDPDKLRREAELRNRLAAEEHADALRASGALTTWTQNIRGKVEHAWLRPPSVTAALDCVVRVTQVPGGEVVRVEIQTCNGDSSARESIEAAVYRASPLPQPADAALFERVIEFRFHPSE